MTLFKDKYRIESTRLQSWDYGWNGIYFITIVTKNREHFFGEIINSKMILSEIGKIAEKYWYEIKNHFPFIKLDAFIVMPNHIHGIIVIDYGKDKACLVSTSSSSSSSSSKSPGKNRFRNPGKNNISSMIGSYKSSVSKHSHKINPYFNWQPRFYDKIIHDNYQFNNVKNYILNNPKKWDIDNLKT